jgi:hypothetical protein
MVIAVLTIANSVSLLFDEIAQGGYGISSVSSNGGNCSCNEAGQTILDDIAHYLRHLRIFKDSIYILGIKRRKSAGIQ